MSEPKRWILTDSRKNLWKDAVFLGHDDLKVPDCTVSKRTLRGGPRDGVDAVYLNNGELSFTVLPTRGMGIWNGGFRDIPLGWNSPLQGPVHPSLVNLRDRGGLGWLYGFDEWICRCGLESNGAPGEDVVLDNNGNPTTVELTLHGKIANTPAHFVDIRSDPESKTVSVTGHVDESALFCPGLRLKSTVSTAALSNRLTIVDEIENLKSTPSELEIIYHCNFGEPFLDAGARLVAPVVEVAPRDGRAAEGIAAVETYLPPTPGYVEQVYYYELAAAADTGLTAVALRNSGGDRAAVLRFDGHQMPCLTQWKNTAARDDGYVTGIEPGTNYPNSKKVERARGRVVTIQPGESYRCELTVEIVAGAPGVARIEQEIERLRGGRKPTVHARPVEKYSGA